MTKLDEDFWICEKCNKKTDSMITFPLGNWCEGCVYNSISHDKEWAKTANERMKERDEKNIPWEVF